MSSIYLYVKQHSVTGLRYFGKTAQDPYRYKGSGKHWLRHIKSHGVEHVRTMWLMRFEDQSQAHQFAIAFSESNNIVSSPDWANLIIEDAFGGRGVKGRIQPASERRARSAALKGKSKSEQAKANMRKPKSCTENMKKPKSNTENMKKSPETRKKMSGRIWITNGVDDSIIIYPEERYRYPTYRLGRVMPNRAKPTRKRINV